MERSLTTLLFSSLYQDTFIYHTTQIIMYAGSAPKEKIFVLIVSFTVLLAFNLPHSLNHLDSDIHFSWPIRIHRTYYYQ